MATIEIVKNINTYTRDLINWTPISLIPDIGITQLEIYFALDGSEVWTKLTKSSWKNTYNGMAQTVSLVDATYTNNEGSEIPANINPTQHKLKIKRVTSPTLYITFRDGAKLNARDLNIVNLQSMHLLEEESFKLNQQDQDIYSYIAATLNNYYTKAEIDESLNNLGLVSSWVLGETYIQGDVVKHNDPNTEANNDLVWYCIANNTSDLQNQPSETGIGATYWSLQKSSALNSLSYIRKLPGATGEELDWNTIRVANANSPALKIITNQSQSVDVINISDYNDNTLLNLTWDNSLNIENSLSVWAKGEVYASGNNWINYTPSEATTGSPVLSIKGRTSQNTIEVVKSTASNNTTNVVLKVDDGSILTDPTSLYVDGGTTEFIGKLIWFANTETQSCYGTDIILDKDGNPPFSEVRFGRDAKFGTLASCSSPFVPTLSLSATTGNIGTIGNITTSATVTATDVVVENVANADYLKTDSDGKIIAGSGAPSTNRIAWEVSGSTTNLANRDVVYLKNSTQLWTKARANSPETLAAGVIDSVTGSSGNQGFSVIFAGAVSGYTGLQVGNYYWLSKDIEGGITATQPVGSGELVDPVGIAVSSTTLFVLPARPHKRPVTS